MRLEFGVFHPVDLLADIRALPGSESFDWDTVGGACQRSAVSSTIMMGWLIDRFHVTTVIMLSTIGTSMSVFLR